MCALNRGDTADETQVLLLVLLQAVFRHIDSVVNGTVAGHRLVLPLKITDAYVLYFRVAFVERAQCSLLRMVQRVNNRLMNESRERQRLVAVQMDDIARGGRVMDS